MAYLGHCWGGILPCSHIQINAYQIQLVGLLGLICTVLFWDRTFDVVLPQLSQVIASSGAKPHLRTSLTASGPSMHDEHTDEDAIKLPRACRYTRRLPYSDNWHLPHHRQYCPPQCIHQSPGKKTYGVLTWMGLPPKLTNRQRIHFLAQICQQELRTDSLEISSSLAWTTPCQLFISPLRSSWRQTNVT